MLSSFIPRFLRTCHISIGSRLKALGCEQNQSFWHRDFLNSFATNRLRYLGFASSCMCATIHLTLIGIFPVTSLPFWTGTFFVHLHLLKTAPPPFFVQLASVHVAPCELVVSFWFMALVGAFVDPFPALFLIVHVNDHALDTSDFPATNGNWPSAEIFFTVVLATRVDETAAEFVAIARSSASVKYFMWSC